MVCGNGKWEREEEKGIWLVKRGREEVKGRREGREGKVENEIG